MSAPHPETRRPDRAALAIAVALAAIGLLIFFQTRAMPVAGQYARVGPTTLPYVLSGAFVLLAIGTAVSALRGGFPPREADRIEPMLWIVGGLALQMLLLKAAGFAIATGLLFALTARGFGRGPLWMTIPIGIAFSLGIYLVFAGLLNLSLPAGQLERLFF